jgi:hypothetical protein
MPSPLPNILTLVALVSLTAVGAVVMGGAPLADHAFNW